ncbi:hypothetical protein FQA47_003829 [Oryzias melastigma]|uniref:Uncharacterized protein n=1 Tax=Oryzias melastigma TaxID=30732 RepID=A0A834CMQ0_ORYME|nr:hypothetical protein FQA47_003829 [Oryzias melastigma]
MRAFWWLCEVQEVIGERGEQLTGLLPDSRLSLRGSREPEVLPPGRAAQAVSIRSPAGPLMASSSIQLSSKGPYRELQTCINADEASGERGWGALWAPEVRVSSPFTCDEDDAVKTDRMLKFTSLRCGHGHSAASSHSKFTKPDDPLRYLQSLRETIVLLRGSLFCLVSFVGPLVAWCAEPHGGQVWSLLAAPRRPSSWEMLNIVSYIRQRTVPQ